jgi:catechol-2,3-dioxygenase
MRPFACIRVPIGFGAFRNRTYMVYHSAYLSPKRENLGNLFMHLTNYAINKGSAKF